MFLALFLFLLLAGAAVVALSEAPVALPGIVFLALLPAGAAVVAAI